MSVFTPLIQKGHLKKIVAISSGMGDIDFTVEANVLFQAPYSISKAALNMAIAKFHVQYRKEGILFMGISPGVVDTGVYAHFDGKCLSSYPAIFPAQHSYHCLLTYL